VDSFLCKYRIERKKNAIFKNFNLQPMCMDIQKTPEHYFRNSGKQKRNLNLKRSNKEPLGSKNNLRSIKNEYYEKVYAYK